MGSGTLGGNKESYLQGRYKKNEGKNRGQELVIMHNVRVIPVDTFRWILEVVFRGEAIAIQLHTTGQVPRKKKVIEATERKTYDLMVEEDGVQFEEMLLKIRPVLKKVAWLSRA